MIHFTKSLVISVNFFFKFPLIINIKPEEARNHSMWMVHVPERDLTGVDGLVGPVLDDIHVRLPDGRMMGCARKRCFQ